MKYLVSYSLIILAVVTFISCDKIDYPNEKPPAKCSTNPPAATGSNLVMKSDSVDYRRILLEDYTGQKCGNCPYAAYVASTIHTTYKDSVVIIGVHAGGFAVPGAAATTYSTDYRTPVGDAWDGTAGFNISNLAGNPNGLINRRDYVNNTHVKNPNNWSSIISGMTPFKKGLAIKLKLITNYDSVTRKLNVDVTPTYNRDFGDTIIRLSVVLYEDSIISPQKDYTATPNDIMNYVHMHMLRGSLNGTWGDQLGECTWYTRNFDVDPKINDKHLYLAAFAHYDKAPSETKSRREVIQVAKVKLR
jgi:hypothetical protein